MQHDHTVDDADRSDRTPTVSALLPCYNAEAFIADTLRCLAGQTWPKLEILIGDDASTDRTLEMVTAFSESRDNVRIIARKQNLGWLANTNSLMENASGNLMFFAFHDDLVAPTYVERLVAALDKNPRAVLAYSDVELTELDGSRELIVFDGLARGKGPLARGLRMAVRPTGWWVPNRGLFRAEAFHRIGGIKRHDMGELAADWPWLVHMAILGELDRVPEVLCHKFYKPASLSKRWKYTPDQWKVVARSAVREIRQSNLNPWSKAVLISCVQLLHILPNFQARLPPLIKKAAKHTLDQFTRP